MKNSPMKMNNKMPKKKLKVLQPSTNSSVSNSNNNLAEDELPRLNFKTKAAAQSLIDETLGFKAETDRSFLSLENSIAKETMDAINEMGFETMTEIQAKAIPKLLEGRDLRGTAKTGSGKTLAFLIPVVEMVSKLCCKPSHGAVAIIVSPTRELSMQTFGVLRDLMKNHSQTYGLVMGGTNRRSEAETLAKGVNIIVATPGRLLDHLQNTSRFVTKNLRCFVIDEADRIFDVGFEEEMKQIVRILPRERQTMLFSATRDKKTNDLVQLALKSELMEVDVDHDKDQATTEGLEQTYVVCPLDKRFLVLYTFIKKNRKKKVMVFLSTCMAVKFYTELLNFVDIPVKCIHGRQKQSKRTTTFYEFSQAESGILLCTDVAARGWDIPAVDWIVQYDPPDDPKEYIHRVGRTARAGKKGEALLFLTEDEIGFTRYLKNHKVNIEPMDITWSKVADIQAQMEKLVSTNYFLNLSAKQAFKGYVRAYSAHSLKQTFDVETMDLAKAAKCFGFTTPPFVDIGPTSVKNSAKRKKEVFGYSNESKIKKAKRYKQLKT